MTALSSAQQSEVKAWEEEILACEHTLTLQQEPMIEPGKGELAPPHIHTSSYQSRRSVVTVT